MNLCIDRGNTRTKIAVFHQNDLIFEHAAKTVSIYQLKRWASQYAVKNVMFSSVKDYPVTWESFFRGFNNSIILSPETNLPFVNAYSTPHTLGMDRIALICAAGSLFPKKPVLVIGAGTCITLNFINEEGVFLGGSIHPGLQMRFWAMHTYTKKLPLIPFQQENPLIGNSTQTSMLSGVVNGAVHEIDGMIDEYKVKNPKLAVIISGGDAQIFESKLKNKIFAIPNCVLLGLNQILNYNVQYQS